jgi:hypothetical protein
VPFGYAWRFHYGDDPSSPPDSGPGGSQSEFDEDLDGFALCDGIEHAPNRFSPKDCHLACAYDPDCLVWQGFPLAVGRTCYQGYRGMNFTCAMGKGSKLKGGRRSKPPSPAFRTDYGFATADAPSSVDAAWAVVDAPHDFIAERGNFTDDSDPDATNINFGYLPRNASWYRKHFTLPAAWGGGGGATYVHFEGVFHHATIFLNGNYLMSHECGYTGFDVRLDNATAVGGSLRYGSGAANENVLTVRADASFGSGHWYEGGGIYRPVQLVHVGGPVQVVRDGLFVPPGGDGASIAASVELEATAAAAAVGATVLFTLFDTDGTSILATATSEPTSVPAAAAGTTATARAALTPPTGAIKRWSTQSPTMYSVEAQVTVDGAVVDTVSTPVGFRTTTFTAGSSDFSQPPFTLNEKALHLRGFSHHNSIGGLGVAIPERVELFRVQASRAMGSNTWRMSHNPYAPALYELLDATGQMCWDENRDYGAKYGGGAYAVAMRDMVKRDRNHPSVIMWSFCNEAECTQTDHDYSGLAFRAAAYGIDPTRPVTANGSPGQVPVAQVDVQGGSHWGNKTFISAHALNGTKPLVLAECCSCTSQREDRNLPACIADQNSPGRLPFVTGSLGVWTLMDYFGEPGHGGWPHVSCDFGQFDIAGFPKPHAYWYAANWAQGFAQDDPGRPPLPVKTVARLLDLPRAGNASSSSPPPSLAKGTAKGTAVYAITTAPYAELYLDGVSQGAKPAPRNVRGEIDPIAWTYVDGGAVAAAAATAATAAAACTGADASSFPVNASGVQCHNLAHKSPATADACAKACCAIASCNTWQFAPGAGCWIGRADVGKCKPNPSQPAVWLGGQRNVPPPAPTPPTPAPVPLPQYKNATVVARVGPSRTDKVLATHSVYAPAADTSGHKLQLTIDVPSAGTGTGGALLLDGRDTALIRAAFVDGANHDALVADATGRVTWRVVSGPGRLAGVSNGDPTSHEWMKSDAVSAYLGLARGLVRVTMDCTSPARDLAAAIDADTARGPTAVKPAGSSCDTSPIVVEASAPGFAAVQVAVPVSVDAAKDGVLAVAKATAAEFTDGFSYLDEFVG